MTESKCLALPTSLKQTVNLSVLPVNIEHHTLIPITTGRFLRVKITNPGYQLPRDMNGKIEKIGFLLCDQLNLKNWSFGVLMKYLCTIPKMCVKQTGWVWLHKTVLLKTTRLGSVWVPIK